METNINGVNVYFERRGEGENRILVLHGWGCSGSFFHNAADAMKDCAFLIPDLPGHGRSSCPDEPWGVEEYARCVYQLLKENAFLPCGIMAHSFGGRIALVLADQHPADFDRLVLTGCAGIRPEKTEAQKKREAEYKKEKRRLETVGKIPFLRHYADVMTEDLRQRYGSADYKALSPQMRQTFSKIVENDLRPLLPGIQAQVLLIWGDKDTETPLWMGRTMEKEIPDAGLVVFENDDHFAFAHQWKRFAVIAERFFTDRGETAE